jgi:amino-acid N-acetyltransferase
MRRAFMTQKLRMAEEKDLAYILKFVGQAGLNQQGIDENVDNFMLLEDGSGKISAIVGIEAVENDGLLRSLIFTRQTGHEHLLAFFQGMIESAKQKGLDKLYLLTNKQAMIQFFETFNFTCVSELPAHIRNSGHYKQTVKDADPIVMVHELS